MIAKIILGVIAGLVGTNVVLKTMKKSGSISGTGYLIAGEFARPIDYAFRPFWVEDNKKAA
jgi:hypothetical protein